MKHIVTVLAATGLLACTQPSTEQKPIANSQLPASAPDKITPVPSAASLALPTVQVPQDHHPMREAPSERVLAASAKQEAASQAVGTFVGWLEYGGKRVAVLQRKNSWHTLEEGDELQEGERVQQIGRRHLELRYTPMQKPRIPHVQLLLQEGGNK